VSERLPFEPHVQSTSRENLFVLTCGQVSSSSSEVLGGAALEHVIADLKQKFDFIVFDAPPLLDFPDSYSLAPKVDRIILVAEAEHTSVEDIERAKRTLEQAGGRILGAVMNRQKNYTPAFLSRLFRRAS
jgi:Mrp family chromosome partitioning ATPase